MKKSLLLLGCTGFVGKALRKALRKTDFHLHVVSRQPRNDSMSHPQEEWFPFEGPWEEMVNQVDGVVNLLGESIADGAWTVNRRERLLRSRVDSVKRIRTALEQRSNIAEVPELVWINASGVGYYGDRGNEELTEQASAGRGFLSELAVQWESGLVGAPCREVRLRLGVVLGNGGMLARVAPMFRWGIGGRLGNGKQYFPWIHIDDAVAVILHCLQNQNIAGPVNAVAPEQVTNAQFTKALAQALHRPALLHAPSLALRIALGDRSALLLDSQRVLPKVLQRNNFSYAYPSLGEALGNILKMD